ncbi:MAG: cyclodeaminase/cyclohydrolase family protein [Candidatus Izimaplasma sp.]|nr:cyclodeaminase/cyclohydrolase family protein [Candidatus Izimaplasma bacterium]
MALMNETLSSFIALVDSNQPTPGGGSVSALAASLGVALSGMLGKVTTNKKAFLKLDESIQEKIHQILNELEASKTVLLTLVDEDTNAFNQIMKAFKLPKNSKEEKAHRNQVIQQATLTAIKVPHQVATEAVQVLSNLDNLVRYGNSNAITDLGVGVLLLSAGIEGALFNIEINLGMLKDKTKNTYYKKEISRIKETTDQLKTNLLENIHKQLY